VVLVGTVAADPVSRRMPSGGEVPDPFRCSSAGLWSQPDPNEYIVPGGAEMTAPPVVQ
jgi:hypothetical protein